jgi:hypothetical protein
MGAPRPPDAGCGHACPKTDALKTALDAWVMGTGALNRSAPTGCWAKGMPRNLSIPLTADNPRNVPVFSLISTVPANGALIPGLALRMATRRPYKVEDNCMMPCSFLRGERQTLMGNKSWVIYDSFNFNTSSYGFVAALLDVVRYS